MVCRIGLAWVLQHLGYPEQAHQWAQEALALTQALASPFNRCNLLLFLAVFHGFRREWRLAQYWGEEALSLATVHGFLFYMAVGTIVQGTTLVVHDQKQEGVSYICQGLTACHTLGVQSLQPWGRAMLAQSYGHLGQLQAGLTALADVPALIATTREAFYAAEIARLRGELRLQAHAQGPDREPETSSITAAERCFQQALDLARQQQAKCWELRAAMSLARLWQQQGRHTAARDLLAPIFGWFTEGFDTADLQDAKALLEALA